MDRDVGLFGACRPPSLLLHGSASPSGAEGREAALVEAAAASAFFQLLRGDATLERDGQPTTSSTDGPSADRWTEWRSSQAEVDVFASNCLHRVRGGDEARLPLGRAVLVETLSQLREVSVSVGDRVGVGDRVCDDWFEAWQV